MRRRLTDGAPGEPRGWPALAAGDVGVDAVIG
jgi:hypothetical protein